MSSIRNALAALALTALVAGPLAAQDRGLRVFARSGGFSTFTNLDEAGTRDFRTGYAVGGGVAVQVHRFVSLRGDFTYTRSEYRLDGVETGQDVNRFFYDAVVQLQYPTDLGLEPYVFAGGGAVTLQEVGSSAQDETKITGTVGLGLTYTLPRTGLGLFIEGKGWTYNPTDVSGVFANVDRGQFELAWTAGLSYRLPL